MLVRLQTVVAFLLLSNAACLLVGRGREHITNDTRQECGGKTKQWIQDGDVRRLEGPAFFFHVQHHNGRGIASRARSKGGYHTRLMTRWSDVDAEKNAEPNYVGDGYQMFQDKSWTDLEDTFETHTLNDLGCGHGAPRVFITSARHPVENLLSHEAYSQGNIKSGLMRACESDNLALRAFAGKVCKSQDPETCEELTRDDLEVAKARVRQMDVIFILEYFPATMRLACTRLGWANCDEDPHRDTYMSEIVNQFDEESWGQLFERNRLGIEFYEYMKQLSFEMLGEDGLDVPSQSVLPVLKSLQHAKALAVPFVAWSHQSRLNATRSSTHWQCGSDQSWLA